MSNTTALKSPSTAARATFWSSRREAWLNWLALGLLLAAWNASDNDAAMNARKVEARRPEVRRPQALRGYAFVSVRAANRVTPQNR